MDLKSYFDDLHKIEADLVREAKDNAVYVTSLFHRERNSTPGCTLSASCRNAARVITDGTHRLATPDEIDSFLKHQQDELRRNSSAEQRNKRQYIVVVDKNEATESSVLLGAEPSKSAAVVGKGSRALKE